MRVLITGGSGFIGNYLVRELLDSHYAVKVMLRQLNDSTSARIDLIEGDLLDPKTLTDAVGDVDLVFHNAAYAADFGPKEKFYTVNVEGTRNLIDACRVAGVKRIVYTSSAGVYGFPNTRDLIVETSPTNPMNPYQSSKLEAERLLLQANDLHISIIRPPLVLGATGHATRLLMQRLQSQSLPYFGSGNTYISIAHPCDVARCMRLAAELDNQGEVFNVVSFACSIRYLFTSLAAALMIEPPHRRLPYSLAYMCALFSETLTVLIGRDPQLTRFRVKSFGTDRVISAQKARKVLGFSPEYDVAATVADIVSWYISITSNHQD